MTKINLLSLTKFYFSFSRRKNTGMKRRPIAKKCTANQRKEHNVDKYIQWVSTLLLTIRVYLHSFSCCNCLRNLRNPAKFSNNLNL